jgi:acyl dehydratase
MLILNKGASQGYVLSHFCTPCSPTTAWPTQSSSLQTTTVGGLITNRKELIVDFRRQQGDHAPIHINRTKVEKVKSFKFLCEHITDNLKWSTV